MITFILFGKNMLRLISKQAQLLTTNDDAALTQPYRQVGRGVQRQLQQRGREKQRLKWENSRNIANGTCRSCKEPLAIGPYGRRFCPTCNPPKSDAPAPPPAAPAAPHPTI